jgi:hypothetical protein
MLDALEWLYARGGWGAVVAAGALVVAWRKDRALSRALGRGRDDARATAVLLHALLRRHGHRPPMASLPEPDDETSAVLHVRDVLQAQASHELDSDIEALLRSYLADTPTEGMRK